MDMIDDARVYDRALSAAEVSSIMNTPPGKDSDTLSITVDPVNDDPTVGATAADTGTEDIDVVYTHAQMLALIGAADVDDADANLSVAISNVANGTLVMSGGSGGAGTTFTFTPTINFNGNLTFDYQVSDDDSPTPATSAVGSASVALAAVNDAPVLDNSEAGLLLSTIADVSGSAAPGLANWTDGEMLAFGAPDLGFGENTTAGTFSSTGFNLDAFAGDADIDALHYVTQTVTVGSGANAITLLAGDLVLSAQNGETLVSTNTLTVAHEDVFAFRPDTPGDYSTGTFIFLLEKPTGGDATGVSLVEQDTVVGVGGGSVTLEAGTFVLAKGDKLIYHYTADTVGKTTTTGTLTTLVDGPDIGIDQNITGVALVQSTTTTGGVTLTSGQLLVTLVNEDNNVGGLDTERQDIIVLDITQVGATTLGSASAILFDGDDLGLSSNDEDLDALTLVTQATLNPIIEDISGVANTGTLVSDLVANLITDVEGDPDGIAITAVDEAGGSWEYSINGGGSWQAVGTVTDGSARVLTATANDLLRFVPNADYEGSASISFRAWDGTDGSSTGDRRDQSATATTAFSTADRHRHHRGARGQ